MAYNAHLILSMYMKKKILILNLLVDTGLGTYFKYFFYIYACTYTVHKNYGMNHFSYVALS